MAKTARTLTYQGDMLVEDSYDEVNMSDGAYSWYFDGSTQMAFVPHNAVLTLNPATTGDWTIEFWACPTATDAVARSLVGKRSDASVYNNFSIGYTGSTGKWAFYVANNLATAWTIADTTSINADIGLWQHIAMVRSGNLIYVYKNGVRLISTAFSTAISDSTTAALTIGDGQVSPISGSVSYAANRYIGYVSNLRITKGTALYTTASFSVSTTPLINQGTITSLLTCQSNTFKDNSSYAHAMYDQNTPTISYFNPFNTETSVKFNGSTQYLTFVPTTGTATQMTTGNFTVEAWIKSSATLARQVIIDAKTGATLVNWAFGFGIGTAASGALTWSATSGTALMSTSASFLPNVWYHVAYVRQNNVGYIYVNGVQQATAADATNYASSYATAYIGRNYAGTAGTYFNGLISNVRLTKTYAVYNKDFTPPTKSFTNEQTYKNAAQETVSFLLGTANAFLGTTAAISNNSKNAVAITNNGAATLSYDSPFAESLLLNETSVPAAQRYNNSVKFTNSTSYYISIGTATVPATGAFTIECWIYTTASTFQSIYSQYLAANANRWFFGIDNNSGYKLTFAHGTAATSWGSTVVPLNQWNHVAVSRDASNNLRFFLNGVLDGTTSSYTATLGTDAPRVSGFVTGGNGAPFQGYISNLRIVTGANIYTGTFTPSTSPLQTTQSAGTNIVAITDPSSVSLLTCQTYGSFVDNSPNNFAISTLPTTLNITTIRDTISTSTFNPFNTHSNPAVTNNYYSTQFNGSTQYITVPNTGTSSSFTFAGDFTVEGWYYPTTVSGSDHAIFCLGTETTNRYVWYITSAGQIASNLYGSGTVTYTVNTIAVNTWKHIAIARVGSIIKLYVDGVLSSTTDTQAGTLGNGVLQIGSDSSGSSKFIGFISNFRVIKEQGIYNTSFTLPTSPLTAINGTQLLTCQSPVVQDNSTTPFTLTNTGAATVDKLNPFRSVTDYSVSLNGSSQYLIAPASTNYNIGSNNFTIESFVYFNSISGSVYSTIAGVWLTAGSKLSWLIQCISSNIQLAYSTTGANVLTASFATTLAAGQWYHIVITRTSGNIRCFVNGIQMGSTTSIATFANPSQPLYIGVNIDGTQQFLNGYISNFRILNGTGLYTAAFTPPTNPLTAITNTVLLTGTHSQVLDYSTYNATLTNQGTATVSSSIIPSFATPSYNQTEFPASKITSNGVLLTNNYIDDSTLDSYAVQFNGTSQYIYPSGTYTSTAFGYNDFTVEFWVFFNTVSGTQTLVEGRPSGTASTALRLNMALVAGSLNYYTAGVTAITGFSPAVNTWYHIALVRKSGVTKMYSNGTQVGSSYTDPQSYVNSGLNRPAFGVDGSVQNVSYFSGCLSNFRIVTGLAVYTANFSTVGLYPLSNIKGTGYDTTLLTCQSNKLIDNSPINATMTNANSPVNINVQSAFYSGLFNGSNQYLSVPASFNASTTTNWTMEGWINLKAATSFCMIGGQTAGADKFYIQWNATNFFVGDGTTNPISQAYTFAINTWYHIAVVNSYGQLSAYINGIKIGTTVTNTLVSSALDNWWIGRRVTAGYYLNGQISNIRITNGAALYDVNFTPPTAQLTASSATLLLTCQSSTFKDNSVNNSTVTNTNSATIIAPITGTVANKQYATGIIETAGQIDDGSRISRLDGSGSFYFNGVQQYVTTRSRTAFSFLHQGAADWTIEWYGKPTRAGTQGCIFSTSAGTQSYIGINILYGAFGSANNIALVMANGSGVTYMVVATTATFTAASIGVWHHVAIVFNKVAATITVYVNGVAQTTNNQTFNGPSGFAYSTSATSSMQAVIGREQYASIGIATALQGYFSNLRITKQQVYTGNFTPPTSPLQILQSTGTNIAAITDPAAVALLTLRSNNMTDDSNYSVPLYGGASYSTLHSPF